MQEVDLPALEMGATQLLTARLADAALQRDIARAVKANDPGEGFLVLVGFKENKSTGETLSTWGANPLIAIRDKAQQEFRAWCVRFGFDPSSRVSLGLGAIKAKSMASDLESKMKKPGGK